MLLRITQTRGGGIPGARDYLLRPTVGLTTALPQAEGSVYFTDSQDQSEGPAWSVAGGFLLLLQVQ